jgi:hypothetical protein
MCPNPRKPSQKSGPTWFSAVPSCCRTRRSSGGRPEPVPCVAGERPAHCGAHPACRRPLSLGVPAATAPVAPAPATALPATPFAATAPTATPLAGAALVPGPDPDPGGWSAPVPAARCLRSRGPHQRRPTDRNQGVQPLKPRKRSLARDTAGGGSPISSGLPPVPRRERPPGRPRPLPTARHPRRPAPTPHGPRRPPHLRHGPATCRRLRRADRHRRRAPRWPREGAPTIDLTRTTAPPHRVP